MSEEVILETKHLKRYFGSVHAVEDVSLRIRRGEIYGFLGANGAGKTTTISMILGLFYPTAGEIRIFGELLTPLHNSVLRRVGTMVGSPPPLMPAFTAYQNLLCLSYLRPDLPRKRIDSVLERVNLKDDAHRLVKEFSSGMKQRLGLAMALLNQPELLVLDEPTRGLDPAGMREMRVLLRALTSEGLTVFLSSHLLHEMELVCDRVAVVQKGRIIKEGAVSQLLNTQETVRLRVADTQGASSALNNLPGLHHMSFHDDIVEVSGISSEEILTSLMKQGIIPKEVTTVHPDLESLFLELTEQNS